MTHDSIDPRGSLAHLVAGRASERPDFGLLYVEDDGPWTIRSVAAAASSLATARHRRRPWESRARVGWGTTSGSSPR